MRQSHRRCQHAWPPRRPASALPAVWLLPPGGGVPRRLAAGPRLPLAFGVPLRQHAVWLLPPGGGALRRLVAGPRPPLASAVRLRRLSVWPPPPTAVFPPRLVAGLWPLPFSGALPAPSMAHSTLRQCSDRDARSAHGRRSFEHRDDAGGANRHTAAVRWSRERDHCAIWPRPRARRPKYRELEK